MSTLRVRGVVVYYSVFIASVPVNSSFNIHFFFIQAGSRGGAGVKALASHQYDPKFDSRARRYHMWVEIVVGSLLCSERFFFLGAQVFPSPKKQHS